MTISAIIMMSIAWLFIGFYTIKFFLKILKSPQLSEHIDEPVD